MQPIDERKERGITISSYSTVIVPMGISNANDIMMYKAEINIEYKKIRNKMTHLISKKKKRK